MLQVSNFMIDLGYVVFIHPEWMVCQVKTVVNCGSVLQQVTSLSVLPGHSHIRPIVDLIFLTKPMHSARYYAKLSPDRDHGTD